MILIFQDLTPFHALTPCTLKVCFAKSIPIVVTFMTTPPVPLIDRYPLQSGTLDAAGAGGVHIIRYVYC